MNSENEERFDLNDYSPSKLFEYIFISMKNKTLNTTRDISVCLWKICSRPLKLSYDYAIIDREFKEPLMNSKKIKPYSFLSKYIPKFFKRNNNY